MTIDGGALRAATDEVIKRGNRFAAHFMEADAADIGLPAAPSRSPVPAAR